MNKNILIAILVLVLIVMGIFLFANKDNLKMPSVGSDNEKTIINVNDEDKAGVDSKNGSVLTPPALPN